MKYFTMREMECRCWCGMPAAVKESVESLVDNVLDPAREAYGKPIAVNSGYRCEMHNREVGGASRSQHVQGEAADIRAAGLTGRALAVENLEIARMILKNGKWDQMILEDVPAKGIEPRWIHVSWKRNGGNRRQVLKKVAGKLGYAVLTAENLMALAASKV